MKDNIEKEIIEGCVRRHRASQSALYQQYYQSMATLCMRFAANEMDAVEMLNNGFLRIFNQISAYQPSKGSLYTWMRKLMVNAALDYLKKAHRLVFTNYPDHEEIAVNPEVHTKFNALEILALIRRLPPATQTVFNLYVLEGYSHQEISDLLSIGVGTSKWHLSEARKQLRQLVEVFKNY